MDQRQEQELTTSVIETLLIGSLGKLLVRKGILSRDEVIDELRSARQIFEDSDDKAAIRLGSAAIDSAVRAVERW